LDDGEVPVELIANVESKTALSSELSFEDGKVVYKNNSNKPAQQAHLIILICF
jgi:hypothetical protein